MKKVTNNLRNYVSTIIGALFMLMALAMYVGSELGKVEFTLMEMITVTLFGWIFLFAKDELIESVFLNVFKLKKSKEQNQKDE